MDFTSLAYTVMALLDEVVTFENSAMEVKQVRAAWCPTPSPIMPASLWILFYFSVVAVLSVLHFPQQLFCYFSFPLDDQSEFLSVLLQFIPLSLHVQNGSIPFTRWSIVLLIFACPLSILT